MCIIIIGVVDVVYDSKRPQQVSLLSAKPFFFFFTVVIDWWLAVVTYVYIPAAIFVGGRNISEDSNLLQSTLPHTITHPITHHEQFGNASHPTHVFEPQYLEESHESTERTRTQTHTHTQIGGDSLAPNLGEARQQW